MSVQQESAPTGAAPLRRQIVFTELGPCTVRIRPGGGVRGPASSPPVVYLHGAAGSWTSFRALLSGAASHDRVLVDLPGWGDSTQGARLEHFSLEAMARAVTGVLGELGYRRWHLVGHSMGGFLALHLAAAWPERTASVAAISATTFGVSETVRGPVRGLSRFPAFAGMLLLMRSMAALGPAGAALVRAVSTTPLMGPLTAPLFADPSAVSAEVIRGLGADARPASFSAAARAVEHYDFGQWSRIACPVLATRGDSDVFTPPSDLARLAGIVPHPRVVTIPHCGHFANIECPEHLQRLLDDLQQKPVSLLNGAFQE
jgi:pimeloyl-ACP methyl ester carboxylesterase